MESSKILNPDELIRTAAVLRAGGKKLVFTNGCFDLFHAGHLKSLMDAKRMGDALLVGVNSDVSVKAYKSDKRPIIRERDRALLVAALDCVDYVTIFDEKSPKNLIAAIQPDVYVKGSDWKDRFLPERETVEAYGGRIGFIEPYAGLSTTWIIERIKEVYLAQN